MTFLIWLLNISILLVCGTLFYFFTPLLDSKVKKITIVTLLLSYSILYLIGYGFRTDMLNAITIRPNGMSISLVGVVLLGFITLAFNFIYVKYRKKD